MMIVYKNFNVNYIGILKYIIYDELYIFNSLIKVVRFCVFQEVFGFGFKCVVQRKGVWYWGGSERSFIENKLYICIKMNWVYIIVFFI